MRMNHPAISSDDFFDLSSDSVPSGFSVSFLEMFLMKDKMSLTYHSDSKQK